MLPLGNWIFDEACRQLSEWKAEGIAPQVLAVNVSGVQLKTASELELTETVLMEATQRHNATLEDLRQLGTRIAIDDFGTGYSSLKYLTTYPVNRLKVAQEFVFRVTVDYRNAAVVRASIRLAHELGLDVIAEGVETEAQMRFLIGAGCEQATVDVAGRPCDNGECPTGYVCHPAQDICVPELAIGCGKEGKVCPDTITSGDQCASPGSFVPCAGGSGCEYGCRTCQEDGTWSDCTGCDLGSIVTCASCSDDCTALVNVATADCDATPACVIVACEVGYSDADQQASTGFLAIANQVDSYTIAAPAVVIESEDNKLAGSEQFLLSLLRILR